MKPTTATGMATRPSVHLRAYELTALEASGSALIVRTRWPHAAAVGCSVADGAEVFAVEEVRRAVPIQSLSARDYRAMNLKQPRDKTHPMFHFAGLWDSHVLRQCCGKRRARLLGWIWQENPPVCVVRLRRRSGSAIA